MAKLVFAGLLFAASSFFVAYSNVPPDLAGVYRMGIAAVAFTMALVLEPPLNWRVEPWPLLALAGACLAADLILWHRSIYAVGPGIASILTNLCSLWLLGIGAIAFKERVSARVAVATLGAFVAVAAMIVLDKGLTHGRLIGWGLGILSGLFYALAVACLKQHARVATQPDPRVAMLVFCLSATGLMGLSSLLTGEILTVVDSKDLLLMGGYALGVQVLGWYLVSEAAKALEASVVGIVLLMEPLLAYLAGLGLGYGEPSLVQFAAAAAALACMFLALHWKANA